MTKLEWSVLFFGLQVSSLKARPLLHPRYGALRHSDFVTRAFLRHSPFGIRHFQS
jgi:hypothetical protein